MLFIVDNDLLDYNSVYYDLFLNCIEKIDICYFDLLIIYNKEYYYEKDHIYNKKDSLFFDIKNKEFNNINIIINIIELREYKSIYCFYQEDLNKYYENIINDNYNIKEICIFYFLDNFLNYYDTQFNIKYDKFDIINTDLFGCSKNVYIINKYHRDEPFKYITNCIHKINHISYENNIYKKEKKFFISNFIKKYINWLKLSSFSKYALLDIMFYSITIIIYISYYNIFKINELIFIFQNTFNDDNYNYALVNYLNNHYTYIENKFKNISILLNFKIFMNYYNSYSEINKIINHNICNILYYNPKNSYVFKIKNNIIYKRNSDNYAIKIVKEKYPYILELVNKNICIAGGFLKSMLLNQKENDIDFFLHGKIKDHFELILNFTKIIEKYFNKYYIIQLYKPKNKVLEFIIINIFKDDIFLKIQLILVNNETLNSLFSSFDLNPCKIAFDGVKIIYTKESEEAYEYLINDIRNIDFSKYNNIEYRIKKYLNYGFKIVVNNNSNILIKKNTILKLSKNIIANVIDVNKNIIEIELFSNNIIENKVSLSIKNNYNYYSSLCIGNDDIYKLVNIKEHYGIVNIRGFDLLYCIVFDYNII